MHLGKFSFFMLFLLIIVSCKTATDKTGEPVVDYKLYQGKWYEIARLPNPFEEGLTCITMTYEYNDDGIMTVKNSGRSSKDPGDMKILTGRAWIPDVKDPHKIRIQFVWPVTNDYLLVHMDESRGLAIIGSPQKHQLWILSRTPLIPDEDFEALLEIAGKNQYNTGLIIRVEQQCD